MTRLIVETDLEPDGVFAIPITQVELRTPTEQGPVTVGWAEILPAHSGRVGELTLKLYLRRETND